MLSKGEADVIEWLRHKRIAFWLDGGRGVDVDDELVAYYQTATREELASYNPDNPMTNLPALILGDYRRGRYDRIGHGEGT